MSDGKLYEYKEKRNFEKTSEPLRDKEKVNQLRKKYGEPIFVIQKHNASSLHYDVRLEIDGVLKSWAVPKGPSTNPSEKRLAVLTEDHPLPYALFEGVIPEAQYGAGPVIVWDIGTFQNKKDEALREQFETGRIEIVLAGTKLQGGYALVHAKLGGNEKNWLLIKMKDDHADARHNPVSTEPKSVLSGKTVEELAEAFHAYIND